MLADTRSVKGIGHAGQFDLTMHRLVGNAEQRAIGHTGIVKLTPTKLENEIHGSP